MAGVVIGLILAMTLIALGVVKSRKSKSVPSEVVGSPQFDGHVVRNTARDISEPREDIEGIVYDERAYHVSDSGRLQFDGLDMNA